MKPEDLACWKCSAALADILLPLSRLAKCKVCNADLHVCRMCRFYDTTVSNSCTEPLAEKVNDKRRKNFCGYLAPDPKAFRDKTGPANQASAELSALFGLDADKQQASTQQQLKDLFSPPDKDNS